MKKILSTILAVAILATISSSVLASPIDESIVTYFVPESYYVTIPEMITVGQYDDNEVVITATTNLEENHILNIRANIFNTMGEVELYNGYSSSVYTYLHYNDINSSEEIRIHFNEPAAQFTGQNFEARDLNRALKIKAINPNGIQAGTYTGIIDFDISINNIVS